MAQCIVLIQAFSLVSVHATATAQYLIRDSGFSCLAFFCLAMFFQNLPGVAMRSENTLAAQFERLLIVYAKAINYNPRLLRMRT